VTNERGRARESEEQIVTKANCNQLNVGRISNKIEQIIVDHEESIAKLDRHRSIDYDLIRVTGKERRGRDYTYFADERLKRGQSNASMQTGRFEHFGDQVLPAEHHSTGRLFGACVQQLCTNTRAALTASLLQQLTVGTVGAHGDRELVHDSIRQTR
jgi:hypothetical protein